MHDIDRTLTEFEPEMDALETDHFEFAEEIQDTEMDSPFSEAEEMDLATELLGIGSDAELDQFLGSLFKRAWRGIRKVGSVVGRVARPLGGILKGVAKKLLPVAAGAVGTYFGGPAGGALGAKLGSLASSALEMEFEGLSPEDKEFEAARRFVRLAGTAARQAAAAAQPGVDAQTAAKNAVVTALKRHIPGLSAATVGAATPTYTGFGRSGRWVRRGQRIILLGV